MKQMFAIRLEDEEASVLFSSVSDDVFSRLIQPSIAKLAMPTRHFRIERRTSERSPIIKEGVTSVSSSLLLCFVRLESPLPVESRNLKALGNPSMTKSSTISSKNNLTYTRGIQIKSKRVVLSDIIDCRIWICRRVSLCLLCLNSNARQCSTFISTKFENHR